jgi:putative tryptophan/tyrosine transport system substrate-binding protein
VDRRRFLVTTIAGALEVPLAVGAQEARKPARIGILHPGVSHPTEPLRVRILRSALGELGYVEGRDFILEVRYGEGRPERLPELAADLVRKQVDVIVASGFAIAAARTATMTIPIIMNFSGDPRRPRLCPERCTAWRECHWRRDARAGSDRETFGAAQRADARC